MRCNYHPHKIGVKNKINKNEYTEFLNESIQIVYLTFFFLSKMLAKGDMQRLINNLASAHQLSKSGAIVAMLYIVS